MLKWFKQIRKRRFIFLDGSIANQDITLKAAIVADFKLSDPVGTRTFIRPLVFSITISRIFLFGETIAKPLAGSLIEDTIISINNCSLFET